MTYALHEWPTERVRFERGFKPKLARLIKETFPGWSFTTAIHEPYVNPHGERVIALQIVLVDGIFGVGLEETP